MGLTIMTSEEQQQKADIVEHATRAAIGDRQELTEADGIRDGFTGKSELVGVIESIYGKIKPDDLVSIYYVKLS